MRPHLVIEMDGGKVIRTKAVRSERCRKLSYSSRKVAKAKGIEQTKLTGEFIRAYKCEPCHAWHIGHPPGTKERLAS